MLGSFRAASSEENPVEKFWLRTLVLEINDSSGSSHTELVVFEGNPWKRGKFSDAGNEFRIVVILTKKVFQIKVADKNLLVWLFDAL